MWIESHQELAGHPKLRKLCRTLQIKQAEAIGYLHLLWWWALSYAPSGELCPAYSEDDIADAVGWEADSKEFFDGLLLAGFLEETESGTVIHDWYDYAGRLLERRETDRRRKQETRAKNGNK